MSEFSPYTNLLEDLSAPFDTSDPRVRYLVENEELIFEESFLPDQIIDLGYESTNTLLNLGSLFLTFVFYGI